MASLLSGIRQTSNTPIADATLRTLNSQRLFEQTPLDDELDDALQTYVSPETRPRRDVPTEAEYKRRLHSHEKLNQHVTGGQWRALALASEATILETPATEERALLKYWVYRILALVQQGCGQLADRELSRLELATRYAAIARNAGGKSPTTVWPFELRLLRAHVPGVAHGMWTESISRLCALQRGCHRVLSKENNEDKTTLYRQRMFRLMLMISGCAIKLDDFALAVQTLDQLLTEDPSLDPRLTSAVARTYLQMGAIPAAEKLFVKIEKSVPKDDKIVLMNRAFYAVATGKWDIARDMFARVFADHPDRIAAGNNAAVCDLYLGNPQAMLNALQQLMVTSPTAAGTAEELVFNYCTGLDLHYDGSKLREAKIKKMIEVGMWAGDNFDMRSFKIQ
ncbi:hypothetical protein IW140_002449 [Coemansia sp. RSA 1813]|nr:hypothetical protein EV178_000950 [Coemansia sp. RSA 1646]KAJ1773053.1 hypothetical protein LPJ74_001004 [Coemansia sp. RSA 1843]KAJ2092171.1 hypothetical protein IW138_001238 [Coemansia sp. RSA 986]KAJ2215308.1 hypothetical protein EV179_002256 [Coemansia sp. RSA 487]KAJ2570356.1 hypothetical protein IW140_002449 [Coemansia sp. RSA 1813]